MRKVFALSVVVLALPSFSHAQTFNAGQDLVLRGIPTVARAFAPLAGVKWNEFAMVLAGICSVESRCDPNYLHYTASGTYSQYQGLCQFNMYQVAKAEAEFAQMLPQIRQLAQSGTISPDVLKFIEDSDRAGKAFIGTDRDRRFHPSYGMILCSTKHIQINKQLATRYANQPVWQAAGHMTAQFADVTRRKIAAGRFGDTISGDVNQVESEAWALGQNNVRVQGLTVHDAINAAGYRFQAQMARYISRMQQITGDLSLILKDVAPFTPPPYQPGAGPLLGVPHSGISTLMEAGMIKPQLAPSVPQSGVPFTPTPLFQHASTSDPKSIPPTSLVKAVPFAASIIAQPEKPKPGSVVLLSWVSIGMKPQSCVVTEKDAEIMRGNERTERVRVPLNATGTTIYKLTCEAVSGTELPIVREAEVIVTP